MAWVPIPIEPPMTVKSSAPTSTGRPAIVAVPGHERRRQARPGHPPPDAAGLDADLAERNPDRGDASTRARASSRPPSCWRASRSGPPIAAPAARRRGEIVEERIPVPHVPRGRRHRRGDGVGVVVPAAEVRLEQPRPLQEEVDVDLPGEAHAAEHLRGGATVQHRGLTGQELGPARSPGRAVPLAGRRGRRRPRAPRRARARCGPPCRRRCASPPGTSRWAGRTARAPARSRPRARSSRSAMPAQYAAASSALSARSAAAERSGPAPACRDRRRPARPGSADRAASGSGAPSARSATGTAGVGLAMTQEVSAAPACSTYGAPARSRRTSW